MGETSGHRTSPVSVTRWVWIVAAAGIAAVLFVAATIDESGVTEPYRITRHVMLRKAYTVIAFALVGYTADKALGQSARPMLRATLLAAAYSGAIEVVQAMRGSHEGFAWNIFDIACGGVGGAVPLFVDRITRSHRST
jgi:hypothetical protein